MTANLGAVLQSSFPQIEPEPSTAGADYTIQNFRRLEAWRAEYATPCLLVVLDMVDRPAYSIDGRSAASSVFVVAMSQLPTYRKRIEDGEIVWAPLSVAIKSLRMPHSDDGQLAGQLVACERNSRVLEVRLAKQLEVARTVEQALHWDEWAQLNPDKAIGQ